MSSPVVSSGWSDLGFQTPDGQILQLASSYWSPYLVCPVKLRSLISSIRNKWEQSKGNLMVRAVALGDIQVFSSFRTTKQNSSRRWNVYKFAGMINDRKVGWNCSLYLAKRKTKTKVLFRLESLYKQNNLWRTNHFQVMVKHRTQFQSTSRWNPRQKIYTNI